MLDTITQDLRFALRSLRRAPGVALVAIGSLAVGIGFAVFIFNFVQQALNLTTIPATQSGRLVDVFTSMLDTRPYGSSSFPDIQDIRARTGVFDELIGYSPYAAALNVDGATRQAFGEIVTGNYFQVLGLGMTLGRPIVPSDDRAGAPRVVVLSEGLWRRRFGSSTSVLGRVLRIRNEPYTVVGVAAKGYSGAAFVPVQFWTPMTWAGDAADAVGIIEGEAVAPRGVSALERRGMRWLFVKGQLAPGQTLQAARRALQALMTQLATEYPATNAKRRFTALDARDVRIHPAVDFAIVPASAALGAVVLLVLVVACTNVSGLLLARAATRRREIAIRFALGASRVRVVRQLLTESVLVAGIAGIGAIALLWTLAVLGRRSLANSSLPVAIEPSIGTPALWFGVALAIGAGIAAGLAPALRTTGRGRLLTLTSTPSLAAPTRRRWTLRDALIVVQTAAAFVLLVTAGLLLRSTLASQRVDLGFRSDGVVLVSTGTSAIGYDLPRATQFYDQALTRIRAIPGVQAAAVAGRVPFDLSFWHESVYLTDRAATAQHNVEYAAKVSAGYFDVLGVRIVDGRNFGPAETPRSPRVAIVTRAFAAKYWLGESAVGKHFRARTDDGLDVEIVGVSADYKVARSGEPPTPYIHYATAQDPSTEWRILVSGAGGIAPPIDRIRGALTALEPGLLVDVTSMDAQVARVLFPLQATAVGLSTVGLVSILFAAVGLYGVISFMVSRRTREFGIMMAVGAAPFQVRSFVLRRGLAVAAAGIVLGGLGAALAATALSRVLDDVAPLDPPAWGAALAVVLAIAVIAHAVPARRAASISPAQALRAE